MEVNPQLRVKDGYRYTKQCCTVKGLRCGSNDENTKFVMKCDLRMVLYDQISKVLKDANKEWFYMTKVLKDANKTGLVIVVYIVVECLKNVESKCTILILVVGSVRYGLCESVRSFV